MLASLTNLIHQQQAQRDTLIQYTSHGHVRWLSGYRHMLPKRSEFSAWSFHGRRRAPTPTGCPWTSTQVLWQKSAQYICTHAHAHNHIGCQGAGEPYLLPSITDRTHVNLTTGRRVASFSCHLSRPQQSTQNLSSNLDS